MIRYFFSMLLLTLLIGCGAMAAERPAGTCGGWVDKDSNKFCDRSEKTNGCQSKRCPASLHNPAAKKKIEDAKNEGVKTRAGSFWQTSSPRSLSFVSLHNEAILPERLKVLLNRCAASNDNNRDGCSGCLGCA